MEIECQVFKKRLLVERIWFLKGLASRGSVMNTGTTYQGRVRSWYQQEVQTTRVSGH